MARKPSSGRAREGVDAALEPGGEVAAAGFERLPAAFLEDGDIVRELGADLLQQLAQLRRPGPVGDAQPGLDRSGKDPPAARP